MTCLGGYTEWEEGEGSSFPGKKVGGPPFFNRGEKNILGYYEYFEALKVPKCSKIAQTSLL
jgi:hypothetical protein